MRKFFQRYTPNPESFSEHRMFAMLGSTLLQPRLWHLNRHSAASGVAIGLFCGLIPGPLQMIGAALVCLIWRANLPVALAVTFYTNPLTIVPLYIAAFSIGRVVSGSDAVFVMPPEKGALSIIEWCQSLLTWLSGLGGPLAIGLVVLATLLSVAGYFIVKLLWLLHLKRAIKRRRAARTTA